jgi:hypothetical protein
MDRRDILAQRTMHRYFTDEKDQRATRRRSTWWSREEKTVSAQVQASPDHVIVRVAFNGRLRDLVPTIVC